MLKAEGKSPRVSLRSIVALRCVVLDRDGPMQLARQKQQVGPRTLHVHDIGEGKLVALTKAHILVEPIAQEALRCSGAQVEEEQRALDDRRLLLPAWHFFS